MDLEQLRSNLRILENRDSNWVSGLTLRKIAEAEFHDHSKETRVKTNELPPALYKKLHGNKKYYSTTRASREYVQSWLKDKVPGKVFLDYACGNGERAIATAQMGSAVSIGIDLSEVSVKNARSAARDAGVESQCVFIQDDCENTQLPDESVDVVLCNGVLHHLDLSHAFYEIRRILRRGGCVLAAEALGYNPLIQLYRKLTPKMRTDWEKEHILSFKDVKFASRFFDLGEVRCWHLTSVLATPFRNNEMVFNAVSPVLDKVDSMILGIPGIRLMGWQFTFELFKRKEA
jgi:SAM-dependent methyltransferase